MCPLHRFVNVMDSNIVSIQKTVGGVTSLTGVHVVSHVALGFLSDRERAQTLLQVGVGPTA